jgi:hypothetical protein
MMGIPLDGPAWMFGDNQSVITSSTIPHSNLNKRHNALSYHRVREAISAKVLYFIHVDGKVNPSDIMTKFLGWAKFWPLIQPLLFWKGETIKGTQDKTPIPQVIAALKEQSPSGLRGVTRSNSISPSGNASKVIPTEKMSAIAHKAAELQPPIPKNHSDNPTKAIRCSRKPSSFPNTPENMTVASSEPQKSQTSHLNEIFEIKYLEKEFVVGNPHRNKQKNIHVENSTWKVS